MARLARLTVNHQLHYVCQTGHNGTAVFLDAHDCQTFLDALRQASSLWAVDLHAFSIVTNGYALLLTPKQDGALSGFIQAIGRYYSRHFNRRYSRTGSLWNSRFRTTLLEASQWCDDVSVWMAYQSNQTVHQVGCALEIVSSTPHYTGTLQERCLTPHPRWWAMGNTPFERESAFAQCLAVGLTVEKSAYLSSQLGCAWVLGSEKFIDFLSTQTSRRLRKNRPGRPKAASKGSIQSTLRLMCPQYCETIK